MFSGELMIRTHNRTLKETPYILNSVGMDITTHPFLSTMVDCLVPGIMVSDTLIWRPFIGVDSFGIRRGMSLDKLVECHAVSGTNYLHPQRTATLNGTNNGSLK